MTTNYLDRPQGKIVYDDQGQGPLVICIPSLGDVRAEYRFLVPQLVAAGYRVVCMDVRGHGESTPFWNDYSVAAIGDDILALIRALNSGPAILVGTSMAAGASVWTAVEAPDQVAGLVLIDPFVKGEVSSAGKFFYQLLFNRLWGVAVWGMYYNSLYPSQKPADFVAYVAALKANLQENGRLEAAVHMVLASKIESEKRLPRVTAPALVVMGSKDPDFKNPEAEAKSVADSVRGTYQMIANAGHYPHAEMPQITGQHILTFLQKVSHAA